MERGAARARPNKSQRILPGGRGIDDVDGDARVVERWRCGDDLPELLHEKLVWQPHASQPAIVIDLVGVFGEAGEG